MDIHQLCIVREPDLAQWFLKSYLPEGRWHSLLRLITIQDLRKELMDLALQKRWSREQNVLARRQSLRKC